MAASPGAAPVTLPNETLDRASELGHISPGVDLQEVGSIGAGPDGAADVQWYRFTLDGPARVAFELSRLDRSSSFDGVLSLFNNDPYDFGDPGNPDGYRLLEQVDGKADGGVASFDRLLGRGTYELAVSGDGNFDFHPLLAGSGLPGSTGEFGLRMSASDAGLGSATGPQVLGSDPAPGDAPNASPLAIRVDLSGPLDPWSMVPGETVRLLYSPDGRFALDGAPVALSSLNFSPVIEAPPSPGAGATDSPRYQGLNELQIFPAIPLAPGEYEVVLAGRSVDGSMVLVDPMGNPLGADAGHPRGQDAVIPFRVAGVDGVPGATGSDDTPSTARDLGDVTSAGLVRIAGAIGVDPSNPVNQVDLYHFTIAGAGDHSLVAEAFAGRIGSPLDPGISLFRVEPDGSLRFVAGNNNTGNPAVTADGLSTPLYTDSALFASLTAGDYELAVACGPNTPSPFEGQPPGSFGVFDPNQPGSAQNGWSTGAYVLNLLVQPASSRPNVVATSPAAGEILTRPPTQITVAFDQPMNVAQLAFQAFQSTWQDIVPGIYIEGDDGTRYDPRLQSYDASTHQATFLMLDALPGGDYRLHLSGDSGLADLGGSPLAGNEPSGDFVVPFIVDASPRAGEGSPPIWTDQEPNDTIDRPQDLGVLFPAELAAGVTISRDFRQTPGQAPQDAADSYRFQVLQGRMYSFTLSGANLPEGAMISLTDPSGQGVGISSFADGRLLVGELAPGTYVLSVGGWDGPQSAGISYTASLVMDTQDDNAPPLVSGPAPAIAIQLRSDAPPTTSTPPPPITTPPATPPPAVEPPAVETSPVMGAPRVEALSAARGPSAIGPPPSGGGPSPGGAPAAATVAIAMPAPFRGGPSAYGVTSTDVGALAASPMGGAVASAATRAFGAPLVRSDSADTQSPVTAGSIRLGNSVQWLRPGEQAASHWGGSKGSESPRPDLRDWGRLGTRLALSGGRAPALVAAIEDHTVATTAETDGGEDESSPSPRPREESPAGSLPRPGEAVAMRASGGEAPPSRQNRVVILAVAGLALGAYARWRGLARRTVRRGDVRRPHGPTARSCRPFQGVGMGRVRS